MPRPRARIFRGEGGGRGPIIDSKGSESDFWEADDSWGSILLPRYRGDVFVLLNFDSEFAWVAVVMEDADDTDLARLCFL